MHEVNILIAFFSGLLSFFAPCAIPLLPIYMAYVLGVSFKDQKVKSKLNRKNTLLLSISYTLGFSIIFVILGLAASSLGIILRQNILILQKISGFIIILFALNILGILKLEIFNKEFTLIKKTPINSSQLIKPFILGVIFALTWSPCVGPVLGLVLSIAASTQTVANGALLLFFYSLGIALPFILISLFLNEAFVFFRFLSKHKKLISILSGGFLLFIGLIMLFGKFYMISSLF